MTKSAPLLAMFSHAEIEALAMAGLVLFHEINMRRLIAAKSGLDTQSKIEVTKALINAGDLLQEAIHSASSAEIPVVLARFVELSGYGRGAA